MIVRESVFEGSVNTSDGLRRTKGAIVILAHIVRFTFSIVGAVCCGATFALFSGRASFEQWAAVMGGLIAHEFMSNRPTKGSRKAC